MSKCSRHPVQTAVFVFGSNLAGVHGAGAALHAALWCGARRGQGEGPMGAQTVGGAVAPACYALPTKASPHQTLSLELVADHVDRFLDYARQTPKLLYQVTRVGCGRAGFSDDQIAPLFDGAPANVLLPGMWLTQKDPSVARVIVAGSRGIKDRRAVFGKIEAATKRLWSKRGFEVVSGCARGVDTLAIEWADGAGFSDSVAHFPAEWTRYGRAAGMIRNRQMSWYGTMLLAFWDGKSSGTRNMIEVAKEDGLHVVVHELRSPAVGG